MQGARQPLSSRAISLGNFTVRWQGTSCSSSFVSKVLGANYNRANNFHPVPDKFATCTGQEVTFEPTSNAHARVDYYIIMIHVGKCCRPDNNKKLIQLPSTLDMGTIHDNVHSHLSNM